MKGYVYILRCVDGSYYVGSTSNLDLRIAQHAAGEGGDYTARRLPVKAVFTSEHGSPHEAFLVERQVKGWSRQKKEALIRGDYAALKALARSRSPVRKTLRQAQGDRPGGSGVQHEAPVIPNGVRLENESA